ncbi:hypothetical protein DPMN_050196 [Dreissena polymorpha]|uniref:RING-type domain-containing protein n=1 Tax=Dreissena polymorpha TaxID=45954 RepID=A0A9D4CFN6_DREPO|nr:hypothetical protein DPMN_050196 [Dreissena polymorpha]
MSNSFSRVFDRSTEQLMHIEWARLRSFETFPSETKTSCLRLAQNGFYYNGNGSEVVCFECDAKFRPRSWHDDISEEHRRLSPLCRFVKGMRTENVPINENNAATNVDSTKTNDALHEQFTNPSARVEPIDRGSTLDEHATETRTKTHSDIESLRRENEILKGQVMCKICMEEDACVVFLPCGHMATCVSCSKRLRKCAMCRTLIQGTIKSIV